MTVDNNDERRGWAEVQDILRFWTNFAFSSQLRTMRFVMNSLMFPFLHVIEKDALPDLDFSFRLPHLLASGLQGWEFAHIEPAQLNDLKQANVIYLLSLMVPFS